MSVTVRRRCRVEAKPNDGTEGRGRGRRRNGGTSRCRSVIGGRVAAVKPNDGTEGRGLGRRWNGRTVGVKKGNRRSGCGRDGLAWCRGLVKLPADRCNCGQEPFG